MNRRCYRLVFSKARGAWMAVPENAASRQCATRKQSRAGLASSASLPAANGSPAKSSLPLALALALALCAMPLSAQGGLAALVAAAAAAPPPPAATTMPSTVQTRIRPDAGAPASQQPTVLQTPNGRALVNIQTPSAGGVSRNAYSQFDVGSEGAILNNSVTNTQTQLGGWVQGNPWLARGAARVILNEVNSSNPSLLYGYLEVAGQGAQVIVANPSGITCNGCGFINTPRVTLTTGNVVTDWADGSVRGYQVRGGQVRIEGAGMNAQTASFTDILTRALIVNAGIWAQEVRVIAGARKVAASGDALEPGALLADQDKPQVAIDLSALGGIYANRIRLIGTQSGVGVRNAGMLMAGVGEVMVTTDGRVINNGVLNSAANTSVQAGSGVENNGTLYAGGKLDISSGKLVNQGSIAAQGDLSIDIAGGSLSNAGLIGSDAKIILQSDSLDNQEGVEISGGTLQMTVNGQFRNRGLVNGGQTRLQAQTLDNLGRGRIYGNHLSIAADTLNNLSENGNAPVIAARDRLDLAARQINNREHAQILSSGDMAIGGALDAQDRASGQAAGLNNASATIEALGTLDIKAARLNNTNEHFSTQDVTEPGKSITEVQGAGAATRYQLDPTNVYIYNDESDHLHTPEGNFESWSAYRYTRTVTETRVATSDPAKIVSGSDMHITAGSVLNDNSQIIAGGKLTLDASTLTNIEKAGERTTTDIGTLTNYWRDHKKGRDATGSAVYAYEPPPTVELIKLSPAGIQQNTRVPISQVTQDAISDQSSQNTVRTGGIDLRIPNSALYKVKTDPASHYLVETDPAFANYRNWLNSDYLLRGLSADPNATQKRLGDGYYEQKLIHEQVAQLTGRRFLDNYSSDEEQYQALMNQGVTYAKAQQLVPGIALTAAQMAQLTSDIVWLVEKDVTLPDGSQTRALVPQLYVRVQPGDLQAGGALIAGDNVQLNLAGDFNNGGSIAGRKVLAVTAENLRNLGGSIDGNQVSLSARQDLDNIGGRISAESQLHLSAGRDINIGSNIRTQSNAQGSVTNVERVASLYVSGSAGTMLVAAGRDVNVTAASVANAGEAIVIAAGRDIKLATVTQARSQDIAWDAKNRRSDATQAEAGSAIQGRGDVLLQAGRDIEARAATVQSSQGALVLAAGKDVRITAGATRNQVDEAHEHVGTSGMLSSTTYKSRDTLDESIAQSSNLSGKTVQVLAGRDIGITGSNLVSGDATALTAGDKVTLAAATQTRSETHFREEKTSGITGSGGVGISIGSQKQSVDSNTLGTSAAASTVGSVQGDVNINAANQYRQTGSDVVAPSGNVSITARDVRIDEARETSRTTLARRFEQSGITVAVGNPVITAIQTADQMQQAATNTSDGRMKALAVANTAMAAKKAVDAVKAGQGSTTQGKENQLPTGEKAPNGEAQTRDATAIDKVGGINLSISVGAASSRSDALMQSDTGRGSTVTAGRDVQIKASGDGEQSKLVLQGSTVRAGGNASLQADNAVQLLASRDTASQQSSSKDASASVGLSFGLGTGGMAVNATASSARGNADGSDVSQINARVEAGQTVTLRSGGDTDLRGAVVHAERVVADVGGQLQIESLQETSRYASNQKSLGGSISIGAGGNVSGSLSASNSKINSDYAAVAEQSGIKAGDGGFDVKVAGAALIKGGAITSTQKAVDESKNRYEAQGGSTLTDIANNASYSASSVGVNLGTAFDPSGKLAPSGTSAGVGRDGDQKSSITHAAISGVAGDQAARTGATEAALPRIFDAERVQKEINAQVQITQIFGREAPRVVADYAAAQEKAARSKGDNAEADKWQEGGVYRVAMQAAVGGLAGGTAGAAGAGTAAALAEQLNQMQDAIAAKLKDAGASEAVAKGASALIGNLAAVGAGGAVSGGSAAAMAGGLNVDANNRQLHPNERKWAKDNATKFQRYLANKTGEKITAEEAYQRLLSAGYAVVDEAAQKGGRSDETAKQYINMAASKDLFVASAAERASPFLNGNADGSFTPEQQARFGASKPGAQASTAVTKAMQYVGQPCSDCRSKVAAIDDAVLKLQEARLLYQDDPGSVGLIDMQIDQLKAGISKDELVRGMAGLISDKGKGIAALLLGTPSRVVAGPTTSELMERTMLTKAIKDVRAALPSDPRRSGNIAVATVEIDGVSSQIAAHSDINEAGRGLVGQGSGNFTASKLPNTQGMSFLRNTDSEYKILDNIADQLGDNTATKGTVKIITERPACNSCLNVADQFSMKYPNIEVQIYDNNGVLLKKRPKITPYFDSEKVGSKK